METGSQKSELRIQLANLFEGQDESLLDEVVEVGEYLQSQAGEVIIKEGENEQSAFVLLSGRLRVLKQDANGNQRRINEIRTGEFFGEMAALSGLPRSTSIICLRDSSLLKISGADFSMLLDKYPSIYRFISKSLIHRLSTSNSKASWAPKQKTICIQAHHPGIDLAGFNQELSSALKSYASVDIINQEAIQAFLGRSLDKDLSSEEKDRLSKWLNEKEQSFDLVILSSEEDEGLWNSYCTRQADLILVLGEHEGGRDLSKTESRIFADHSSHAQDVILLLWTPGLTKISGTKKWLESRRLSSHFHLTEASDFAKLARYLTNNSIKLILGGGGARGFAHLGVIKAIKELNIPIDYVGGTSIGSIMGAGLAVDWTMDEMLQNAYDAFVKSKPLKDYHLPLVSLIRGRKLKRALHKYFGGIDIEDLRTPFLAIAADLSKAQTVVLDHGPLDFAIRASIALPTILPPAVRGNSLLVDGGVVDNLPFDPLASKANGYSIGVDLSSLKERELGYQEIPSNKKLLRDKFRTKKRFKVPNMIQIIMGTLTLASGEKRLANQEKFDLYLSPEIGSYGFMAWKDHQAMIDEGYNHSFERLKEWKEKTLDKEK